MGASRRSGPARDPRGPQHPVDRQRPVHPHRLEPRPGVDDGAQPLLLGGGAPGRPDRLPLVLEPGSHDPGAPQRRDRLRRRAEAVADRLDRGDRARHRAAGRLGLVAEPRLQLRRPGSRRRSVAGAARHHGSPGVRDGDRQAGDRRQGLPGHRDARRHDHPAGVGLLAPRHPPGGGVRIRSGGRERHARRRRVRRRRRRRHPGGSRHRIRPAPWKRES